MPVSHRGTQRTPGQDLRRAVRSRDEEQPAKGWTTSLRPLVQPVTQRRMCLAGGIAFQALVTPARALVSGALMAMIGILLVAVGITNL